MCKRPGQEKLVCSQRRAKSPERCARGTCGSKRGDMGGDWLRRGLAGPVRAVFALSSMESCLRGLSRTRT